MEEIIASISRIIAEDGRPGDTPRPAPAEQKDVFELTEAIGEDGSVRRIKPAGAADGPTAKPPDAAAASFARLGAMPRERPREGELLMGAGDRTLEEIVRETLRPLLQAWLDEHLPAIVERLVREEIARVVCEAGIR
jgi:cell pole-organizing protein PopZ